VGIGPPMPNIALTAAAVDPSPATTRDEHAEQQPEGAPGSPGPSRKELQQY